MFHGWIGQWSCYWYVAMYAIWALEYRLTYCLGPCIGGIIVTFAQWRIIYWLQFGMTLLGLILSLLFVPSVQEKNLVIGSGQPWKISTVFKMFNPFRIFRQFIYPNVFIAVSI